MIPGRLVWEQPSGNTELRELDRPPMAGALNFDMRI